MADALGVSLASVAGWARQGMPGKQGAWPLPAIVKWLREDGPWQTRQRPDAADPMLDDSADSPGLERYRMAKASLAELELEERKRSLVSIEKARPIFQRWAIILRNMGERLAKRFGNDAAEVVNEALSDCKHVIDTQLGGGESADDRAA